MKKQIIIALTFAICSFSFAQKKELKAVEKAIKGANFSEAKTALTQAEAFMDAMDDKSKEKYHYLKAQAFYSGGKGKLKDYKVALASLKKVKSTYKEEKKKLKQEISNSLLTEGNKAYEAKDYSKASKYFENAYNVTKKDTLFLYYAAATAVSVQEYDRALGIYEQLKALGFTGKATQYYAVNNETGKEDLFSNKQMRDLSVKTKTHKDPSEKLSKSKKPEIVKNIALIYVSQGDNEKAIEAMKDARAESPDDVNLLLSEANVHFKMGNTEKFKALLEEATAMAPDNAELQYNLGVIAADSGDKEKAKKYYERAIEIKPEYINAYINLSALILSKEGEIIEEMNGLGTSAADDKRYEELREQRQDIYRDAIPYLSKALEIDAKSLNAAKTLMNIYSILGETDKYKAMKAKVEELESAN